MCCRPEETALEERSGMPKRTKRQERYLQLVGK